MEHGEVFLNQLNPSRWYDEIELRVPRVVVVVRLSKIHINFEETWDDTRIRFCR